MAQLQRLVIAPSQFQQEQILLTPQQQHYLGRVLRFCDGDAPLEPLSAKRTLRERDRFIAMDGKGKCWLAQLQGEKAQI
jgi:16S rRNA (uracil1498-N3)-methyltransferase